jgi:hypothetical protein
MMYILILGCVLIIAMYLVYKHCIATEHFKVKIKKPSPPRIKIKIKKPTFFKPPFLKKPRPKDTRIPISSDPSNFMSYVGCMSLTRDTYASEQQMLAAPFLVVPIVARDINGIMDWTKRCIMAMGRNQYASFRKQLAEEAIKVRKAELGIDHDKSTKDSMGSFLERNRKEQKEFIDYDPVEAYKERLRELLKILDLMQYEEAYMSQYAPKSEEEKGQESSVGKRSSAKVSMGLPSLRPPKEQSGGEREPYKFMGPAYIFVANDHERKSYVEAFLYFPSMTKDARPAPNFDFMGKCHRWLQRMIFDPMYNAAGTEGCGLSCFGTQDRRVITRPGQTKYLTLKFFKKRIRIPIGYRQELANVYYMPCGCRSDNLNQCPIPPPEPKKKKKKGLVTIKKKKPKKKERKHPGPPKVNFYVAYRINLNHPSCKPYFSPDSSHELSLNILPSNWDMYAGCKYNLISNNRQYFLKLETAYVPIPGTKKTTKGKKQIGKKRKPAQETQLYTMGGRMGLYRNNGENLVELCAKGQKPKRASLIYQGTHKGSPRRLVLEGGVLTIYAAVDKQSTDDSVAWTMRVANEGAEEPLALVVLDNGQMDVFDKNNKSVVSDEFRRFLEKGMNDQKRDLGVSDYDEEYDPAKDYARRLQHLIDWLRARRLLFDYVANVADLKSHTVRRLTGGDLGVYIPYDPTANYAKRVDALIKFLRENGYPDIQAPSTTLKTVREVPKRRRDPQPMDEEERQLLKAAEKRPKTKGKQKEVVLPDYDYDADFKTRLEELMRIVQSNG